MGNSQGASQQQLMMQIAQALQQGADPQVVAQQLMQMGYTQEQVVAMIQQVTGQGQMADGGSTNDTYYQGMSYAHGGTHPYMYTDPYSYMAMGGMIPMAANGMEVPLRPEAQDFPDYGSFKAADDAWIAQYGEDAIPMYDDSMMMDYEDPTSIASYNNPALAMVGPQLPTGMATNVVTTPISKPKLVDFITALGGKTDFKTRAKLAKAAGIPNYKSKPEQDSAVLDYLRVHADAISKNPEVYNVHPAVANHVQKVVQATAPTPAAPSIPTVDISDIDSAAATPTSYSDTTRVAPMPDNFYKNLVAGNDSAAAKAKMRPGKEMVSGLPASTYAGLAGLTGLGYGALKLNQKANQMVAKGILESPKANNLLSILNNKNISNATEVVGKDLVGKTKAMSKLPAKMKKAITADEANKVALEQARAEQALVNAHNVQQALKEAEAEKAAQALAKVRGAGKAAPSIMDMIMSKAKAAKSFMGASGEAAKALMKENRATKFFGEGIKGAGEILKGFKFEEGGYVPDYGMAYGGTPQAMYGMGMAQGGSIYKEGRDLRDYTHTAAYTPGGWSGYPVDLPPVGWGKASYAAGGQMPQWLAQRRFAAAGNEDNMSQYGYDDGGMVVGQEMYATPEQLQRLKQGGYQFEIMK